MGVDTGVSKPFPYSPLVTKTLKKRTVACITGAHRSGTSMVARLLHTCGLDLGPESDLMAPAQDNPDGFWENLSFVAINDELLNELGGAWDLPPRSTRFAEKKFDAIRAKARTLVSAFSRSKVWGWKDPRNSLTLPFWRAIVPELRTIIVVRNPLEVAHSLHQRNGLSFHLAFSLWRVYNQHALAATAPKNRIVSHYDSFFDDPHTELVRISSFLDLPNSKAAQAAALISRERRHTHFTMEQLLDAQIPPQLFELYRQLSAEAGRVADVELEASSLPAEAKQRKSRGLRASYEVLTKVTARLPRSPSLNLPVLEAVLEADRLRKLLATHHAEFQRLNAHIERVSAAVQRSEEQLNQRHAHIERVSAAVQRSEEQLKQRDAHIERVSAAVQRSEEQLKQRDATLATHNAEFQRLNAEIEQISSALSKARNELKEREKRISHMRPKLVEAEHQHATEIQQLRDRIMQINGLLHRRSVSLAEHERCIIDLTNRLRKQLWDTKRLSHLLDDAENAAARLRSSRRWKLANPGAAIQAKVFPGKVSLGYGHLEKIVAAYSRWRASHPDIAKIEDEIKALQFPMVPTVPAAEPATTTESAKHVAPVPQLTPENKAPAIQPPVPSVPVESIHFPAHGKIDVSIIIPVFNQFRFTHSCLASLQTIEERSAFEVIVVDDCSTDETAELGPRMDGVVYLCNETNAGFIASCNRGAEKARGEYLFFLNNDTIVKPRWLTALLDTFAEEPRAGIVGSKLVYPDGRLQEAGGIIWCDASGWNYGKFDDPEKPEYNFLREVDYCSGAAIMIRKSLFQKLGGFDAKYEPAYYEDADLSFKVRKAGYKVFYQPLSEIIHYEGMTGGTDLSTGTKKHQDINRLTFADTWAAELVAKPVTGNFAFFNQAPPGQKNILVIDHHLPMPGKDAGSLRMFHILNILHRLGHRVTFILDNLADIPPHADELQKRGIEVIYHPYIKKVRDYLVSHGSDFDAVILSRCDFARKHIKDVRLHAPQSRVIFDTVDLHFLRTDREARITNDSQTRENAREKEKLEYDLIDQADETWVVSGVEQKLLREARPDKSIEIVPTIVDVPGSKAPFSLRRDFLFIGGFQHTPNIDAVIFFLKKIYPLVTERLSDAKFYIIGYKAPPEVVALATDNVIVTGLQADVRPFFEGVKLSVAPLRYGAGIKGKINLSMGFGVPVVATSLAVEGMALTDREDVLIADEPEDFARAVVELYESEDLWNRISENGIKKTRAFYSTDTAREKLELLFSDEHLSRLERSAAVAQPDMVIA